MCCDDLCSVYLAATAEESAATTTGRTTTTKRTGPTTTYAWSRVTDEPNSDSWTASNTSVNLSGTESGLTLFYYLVSELPVDRLEPLKRIYVNEEVFLHVLIRLQVAN